MVKRPDARLSRANHQRFVWCVQQRLQSKKRNLASIGVPRSVFYAWRVGRHRVGRRRAVQVLRRLGLSWEEFKATCGVSQDDGLPEMPVNAGIAWDLANMLAALLGVQATITAETQTNAVWFAKVQNMQLAVHMSRWCEVYEGATLVLAGPYSLGFRGECARIAQLISAPVRRHKKKSQMSISRLQNRMRALHLGSDATA